MEGFAEKREFSGLKFSFSSGKKPIGEKIGENQKKSEQIRKNLLAASNYTCSSAHDMVKFYIKQKG